MLKYMKDKRAALWMRREDLDRQKGEGNKQLQICDVEGWHTSHWLLFHVVWSLCIGKPRIRKATIEGAENDMHDT